MLILIAFICFISTFASASALAIRNYSYYANAVIQYTEFVESAKQPFQCVTFTTFILMLCAIRRAMPCSIVVVVVVVCHFSIKVLRAIKHTKPFIVFASISLTPLHTHIKSLHVNNDMAMALCSYNLVSDIVIGFHCRIQAALQTSKCTVAD